MQIDLTDITTLVTLITTILTAIGGCYLTIRKVVNTIEKSKKRQANTILQMAKDNAAGIKLNLEAKIHELETKIITLEESVQKDIGHLKETYNNEIKFLGQKIESLRQEVHDQHGQLMTVLTKMIGKD